jgi:putative transposase
MLVEWNTDEDHVHIMFKAQPNNELSKFINAYKSSRLLKKECPAIHKKLLFANNRWRICKGYKEIH